jgi:hypothetical protein
MEGPSLEPRLWVKNLKFSDGTDVAVEKNDVVIIVGPNNGGKSATLRGIRDKLNSPAHQNIVLKEVVAGREGTTEDLIRWLGRNAKCREQPGDPSFEMLGSSVHSSQAQTWWSSQPGGGVFNLSGFFCRILTAEERLQAAGPAGNIALARDAPQHPIHFLQRDDTIEARLSEEFSRAFDADLIVHRNAGNNVPLHVGKRPQIASGQDRVSLTYVTELEKLPPMQTQGDGMRSFAGVLLSTAVGPHTILLVDEPEAFLHPPQARHLGRVLVSHEAAAHGSINASLEKQLFIATHSGDVLRGALDSESNRVRVLRLRRQGEVNVTRELSNTEIKKLWSDPLLRYSNVLDGLFHEKVVLTEADSDCRFYAATMDAMLEANSSARRSDIMFTHCGGKDRLPVAIRSLRALEVPMAVAVDFDVLNNETVLRNIVEASHGEWSKVEADWRVLKQAIDSKKPELSADEVKKDIQSILEAVTGPMFPNDAKRNIQEVLRRSSPWSVAKTAGVSFIPSGQPSQACSRLLATLESMGIFVVPVGEIEGFCRTVGNHGPRWAAEVLKKDLGKDEELQAARNYVARLIA